tara:strand:- start:257 stop:775 length:519 start_codon:yes stop_codon:yes gene_type:complete
MIKTLGRSILTLFGIGYSKYAPGTVASFITCLTYFILGESDFSLHKNKIFISFFLIIIFIYSIIIIDKFYKKNDAREIVIDEFMGQSIPLIAFLFRPENFIPNCCYQSVIEIPSVIWILLSFILFRFFDIVKPYPINLIDKKIKNGFGVMFDDVVAGIFTTLILYIVFGLWY